MSVTVAKVGQGRPKSKDCGRQLHAVLPRLWGDWYVAYYERARAKI